MSDEGIRYEDRMSNEDALMWAIDKDPALRSTITSVFLFDRPIDRDLLVRRFERMSRVIPRFHQRVRSNMLSLATPRWEVDPNFDLAFHLWWVKAPGRRRWTDVLSLAEPIAMSGFDRARPQWRAIVVEGLVGGQSAIIMKLHHSITDGVGGMKLLLEMLDLEASAPDRPRAPAPEVHVMSQPERFVDAFQHLQRRQLDILRRSAGSIPESFLGIITDPAKAITSATDLVGSIGRVLRPASHPLSPLMTGRSLSYRFDTMTVPLDTTKRAAKRAGGRLNDAFVAGVARGLHLYHQRHGVECASLRMAIPINVRTAEREGVAGNAFVPARIELPIDIADPMELMEVVHDLVGGARAEPANSLVEPIASILNQLPTTAVTALFGSMVKSVDFTTSNVPGAPFPVYLGGAEMLALFPFGPLAGAALNITLLSYQNDLNIGINADPAAVPDGTLFHECLTDGFRDILSLA
mgnify:CR=1 FL=1